MKNIILTGATSMLGVSLINECIKHEINIYALVRRHSGKINRIPESKFINIIECDLSELENLSGLPDCEVFYHFGWEATNKAGRNDPESQAINIIHSIKAARLAKKFHCQKFIFAGSQAEYGIHEEEFTTPETYANPITAYGISKLAAGKLCALECRNLSINFAHVRIFSTYGINDSSESMIISTLKKLIHNEHCSLTQGIQKWDYLYCDDAARAFYLLGESDSYKSEIYCLGSGQSQTIKYYIQAMKEITGSKSELGFGEVPYINNVPPSMCADISKLTRDTGFKPSINFSDGINKIVKITYGGGYYRLVINKASALSNNIFTFTGRAAENAA